jgi:hypothetical protein
MSAKEFAALVAFVDRTMCAWWCAIFSFSGVHYKIVSVDFTSKLSASLPLPPQREEERSKIHGRALLEHYKTY